MTPVSIALKARAGSIAILLIVATACGGDTKKADSTIVAAKTGANEFMAAASATGASAATATTTAPPPAQLEPDASKQCDFTDTPLQGRKRCSGFLPASWQGWGVQDSAMTTWIQGLKFDPPSDRTDREFTGAGPKPRFTIEVVSDADSVALSKLSDRGLVMARITADANENAAVDTRYRIDRRGRSFLPEFFVVITKFDDRGTSGQYQQEVAKWRLYGIEPKTRKLKPIGDPGTFARCLHFHSVQDRGTGARFNTCEKQATYDAAFSDPALGPEIDKLRPANPGIVSRIDLAERWAQQAQADSTSIRGRLDKLVGPNSKVAKTTLDKLAGALAMVIDLPTDPGWMTCGLGCCVADQ